MVSICALIILWLCLIGQTANAELIGSQWLSLNGSIVSRSSSRRSRWFPFYTIARFRNLDCIGSNQLSGTCVLAGECADGGGIATGNCNTITRQAVCCVYQATCDGTTFSNNTFFVNSGYPGSWSGGPSCGITVNPCSDSVCQLRIDFLDLSLAPPNGDGVCNQDILQISGGALNVPTICGENSGQHVIVDFIGTDSISIAITATSSYEFGRHWLIKVTQINCDSQYRAPRGCLQYYQDTTGVIQSFNYNPSASSSLSAIGMGGTRQIAGLNYGICIRAAENMCTISYEPLSSDVYSFTVTGDVGAVDPVLLGTDILQSQICTTDYIIIPNPSQTGQTLISDRFCGLGLRTTTSNNQPFIVYSVSDASETLDIGNRGFALTYTQNQCSVV